MIFLLRKIIKLVPAFKYINLIIKILKIINAFVMAEKKGILSKNDEKWLASFMDAAIKLKGIAELIDGGVIRVLVTTIDNIVVEKYVPENWQNPIKELIVLGKERNKEGIAEWMDKKIDLPFVDDVAERIAFESVVHFIAAKMYSYIDSFDLGEV